MFEADLWNSDSLSRPIFFRCGHCVNTGVQKDNLPAPVPQEKATLMLPQRDSMTGRLTH